MVKKKKIFFFSYNNQEGEEGRGIRIEEEATMRIMMLTLKKYTRKLSYTPNNYYNKDVVYTIDWPATLVLLLVVY